MILASGGFEGNDLMKDAYLPLAPMPPVGHAANDGAGVLMAHRAGAALWHMYGFFGWLAFRTPEFPAAFTIDVHGRSHVLVDADSRRFSDELGWEVHDKLRSLTAYSPKCPNHPHLPVYAVFDEATRLAGPLHGIVGTPNDYRWSADNAAGRAGGRAGGYETGVSWDQVTGVSLPLDRAAGRRATFGR